MRTNAAIRAVSFPSREVRVKNEQKMVEISASILLIFPSKNHRMHAAQMALLLALNYAMDPVLFKVRNGHSHSKNC
jgi:hypothetical protein